MYEHVLLTASITYNDSTLTRAIFPVSKLSGNESLSIKTGSARYKQAILNGVASSVSRSKATQTVHDLYPFTVELAVSKMI